MGLLDKLKGLVGMEAQPKTLEEALEKLAEARSANKEALAELEARETAAQQGAQQIEKLTQDVEREQAKTREALEKAGAPQPSDAALEVALFAQWLAKRKSETPQLGKRNPLSGSLANNLVEMFLGSRKAQVPAAKKVDDAFERIKAALPDM